MPNRRPHQERSTADAYQSDHYGPNRNGPTPIFQPVFVVGHISRHQQKTANHDEEKFKRFHNVARYPRGHQKRLSLHGFYSTAILKIAIACSVQLPGQQCQYSRHQRGQADSNNEPYRKAIARSSSISSTELKQWVINRDYWRVVNTKLRRRSISFLRFGQSQAKLSDLSLVAVSHLHPDHVSDLPALLWLSHQIRKDTLPIVGPSGK